METSSIHQRLQQRFFILSEEQFICFEPLPSDVGSSHSFLSQQTIQSVMLLVSKHYAYACGDFGDLASPLRLIFSRIESPIIYMCSFYCFPPILYTFGDGGNQKHSFNDVGKLWSQWHGSFSFLLLPAYLLIYLFIEWYALNGYFYRNYQ